MHQNVDVFRNGGISPGKNSPFLLSFLSYFLDILRGGPPPLSSWKRPWFDELFIFFFPLLYMEKVVCNTHNNLWVYIHLHLKFFFINFFQNSPIPNPPLCLCPLKTRDWSENKNLFWVHIEIIMYRPSLENCSDQLSSQRYSSILSSVHKQQIRIIFEANIVYKTERMESIVYDINHNLKNMSSLVEGFIECQDLRDVFPWTNLGTRKHIYIIMN